MGPEFLGAGLITFELRLRAGLTSPRDNEDCRERKNGSIKSRFHHVTPLCSHSDCVLFCTPSRDELWSTVRWIRPQNGITSAGREKRVPRQPWSSGLILYTVMHSARRKTQNVLQGVAEFRRGAAGKRKAR